MHYYTFCAANSGKGFISLFDEMIDEEKYHIFYIKGGPGSGKSTLMKKIAKTSTDGELILCSGDPSSLDGVWLPKRKALILDATAPHSYEPIYPGVGGTIIDLGEARVSSRLNKESIIQLTKEKKPLYKSAYSLLESAMALYKGGYDSIIPLFDHNEFKKTVTKILQQNGLVGERKKDSFIRRRYLSAITSDGCVTLKETVFTLGKNVILIKDSFGCGTWAMELIKSVLEDRCIDCIHCYHPLFGKERLQHILIPQAGLSFITDSPLFPARLDHEDILMTLESERFINLSIINKHRNKLEFIRDTISALTEGAAEKLKEARNIHWKIEEEYRKGTDFAVTEQIGEILMNKLNVLY